MTSAAVTVFCAVWHGDAGRAALIAAHRDNLRRQSMPVEVIYVFDGGDAPLPGLEAHNITSSSPLTIYQAWNLALTAVKTPLVMNPNLDDRLAPDAVEKLAAIWRQAARRWPAATGASATAKARPTR